MAGKATRAKGRRGETAAKRLLADRDYTILADTSAGLSTDDLVVMDAAGKVWSVEVKNTVSINVKVNREQARKNCGKNHWMLLCRIDQEGAWLVFRKGERVSVWHDKA
jgi:hypothetical protein